MRKRYQFPLILLLVVLTASTGHLAGDEITTSNERPLLDHPRISKCQPGKRGGRLTIATEGLLRTFNVFDFYQGQSVEPMRLMFNSLVAIDAETDEAIPELAESWESKADQKTWIFKLRKGLKWSDGHPLTSEDVVFTINQIYKGEGVIYPVFPDLRAQGFEFEISKLDDLAIKVGVNEVYALLLPQFSRFQILPKHKFEKAIAEKNGYSLYQYNSKAEDIVGSGPFRAKEFRKGEFTLLERNPFYHVVDKTGTRLPYLDEVQFNQVSDAAECESLLLENKNDVIDRVRPIKYEPLRNEAAKGLFRVVELGTELDREFLCFNQMFIIDGATHNPFPPFVDEHKLKWFRDAKFHKAVSQAIDRQEIIDLIHKGRAESPLGFFSPANRKWASTNITEYPYNPAKARALLADIGITNRDEDGVLKDADGKRIEFVLTAATGNERRMQTAEKISEQLGKLGIKVQVQYIDFESFVQMIHLNHGFECVLMFTAVDGVIPFSNALRSSGEMHLFKTGLVRPWERKIDTLIAAAIRTTDYPAQKKLMDEVQMIMADQLPLIYTTTRKAFGVARSDLANLRPAIASKAPLTWNIEELYFRGK